MNKDTFRIILDLLDEKDLIAATTINKRVANLICNKYFWINKFVNIYGFHITEIDFFKRNNTYWAYYFYILNQLNNEEDKGYDKLLIHSSKNGRLDLVKIALQLGANIHAENDYALRWASDQGRLEVVRFLVDNGANIHAKDDEALRRASLYGHYE
ncbi:unnamed protein product, partial [marine sediment metagenome]